MAETPQQPEATATLTITMTTAGQVSVNGPIENRLLCYGLLEIARDTIVEFNKKSGAKILVPPPSLRFGGS